MRFWWVLVLIPACFTGGRWNCVAEEIMTYPSPWGNARAVVYLHSCGATTDPSQGVVLIAKDQRLLEKHVNAAILDVDRAPSPESHVDGHSPVTVEWLAARKLRLLYDSGTKVNTLVLLQNGFAVEHVRR